MRFLSLSYHRSAGIGDPQEWFSRIALYTGSWEIISRRHTVDRIDLINYCGDMTHRGIQYHFLRSKGNKLYFPRTMHSMAAQLRPDIVVVNGLHYPLQVIQLKQALPPGTRIIAQHHAEKPFTGIKKYWQRWADRSVDAYLFASQSIGSCWVRQGNITDAGKIHEVMEVSSRFMPMEQSTARQVMQLGGHPLYLWVGRLDANKDPMTVVRAFVQFLEFQPCAKLYMIFSTGELQAEVESVIPAEYRDQIRLVGSVPHEQMMYWYSSADFIISGSHYEGSGTAVCEAMSCGCIPVLTDIDSFKTMTDGGRAGWLYSVGDPQSLLARLVETVSADRQTLRNSCLNQFRRSLSFEAIAEKIQAVAASL